MFESKVAQFAQELAIRFTLEGAMKSFLMVLDAEGNVTSLTFETPSSEWTEMTKAIVDSGVPHLFYDPLDDGMEYVWLSWRGIEQVVMERLIGQKFDEADFVPLSAFAARAGKLPVKNQFPPSWGVMF
jgi:hypothetical protein